MKGITGLWECQLWCFVLVYSWFLLLRILQFSTMMSAWFWISRFKHTRSGLACVVFECTKGFYNSLWESNGCVCNCIFPQAMTHENTAYKGNDQHVYCAHIASLWIILQWNPSLVPRPSPSFPLLAVQYWKRREAGQGPGNEASGTPLFWTSEMRTPHFNGHFAQVRIACH